MQTEMWVVVIIAPTLAVHFPTDRILELSTIEIGKADFAETVATEDVIGFMRGMKILDTGTTVVQREWMAGAVIVVANGINLALSSSFVSNNASRKNEKVGTNWY
jgi:hypothetical protein